MSQSMENALSISQQVEEDIATHLYDWMTREFNHNDSVPVAKFISKAKEIAKAYYIHDFEPNDQWFDGLCKQNGWQMIPDPSPSEAASENAKTGKWKDWCKCCGSCAKTIAIVPEFADLVKQYFQVHADDFGKVKLCSRCCQCLAHVKALMEQSGQVSQMFTKLQQTCMTLATASENLNTIREEFGLRPMIQDSDDSTVSDIEEYDDDADDAVARVAITLPQAIILIPCQMCNALVNVRFIQHHLMEFHSDQQAVIPEVEQQPEDDVVQVHDSELISSKVESSQMEVATELNDQFSDTSMAQSQPVEQLQQQYYQYVVPKETLENTSQSLDASDETSKNESQQAIAGTPTTSHQCPWCDTIYSLKRNLTSHLRTKHPLESKETTNANTRSSAKRRRE